MCYFDYLLTKTNATIDTIVHHLDNPVLQGVNMVVGIGLSGTMGLVPVMQKSGVAITALRKRSTTSHGGRLEMSSYLKYQRYVILDDFVDSGKTLTHVRDTIRGARPHWVCAGVLLYQTWYPESTFDDVPIISLGDEIAELDTLRKIYRQLR